MTNRKVACELSIDTKIDDLGWSNFVGISPDFAILGGNNG